MQLFEVKDVEKQKKSGIVVKLETDTGKNDNFRKVLYTTENSQLVLMTIAPSDDIGLETHDNGDQFIRIEEGNAVSVLDGKKKKMGPGDAVVIPKGVEHNITNTSSTEPLKVYVVYSPPQHKDGTIDKVKPKND